ncbi:hypothetical protein SAMN04487949_1330 [Halogranum gelatinilyticum]|uniref:Uncharacterized protein n=1 Tax=Halogranum gelatinilyticum TaxID=660521 RepID=A0A1G9RGT3_9EURY|nr:hypothetical protein [Halogranum gelatinilyticum]SDM22270.1 hypothetical protein SAMN04487949_1330 [Halogranum gelatinilyticum]
MTDEQSVETASIERGLLFVVGMALVASGVAQLLGLVTITLPPEASLVVGTAMFGYGVWKSTRSSED